MNIYFEENKHKLLNALLPLMPESQSYDTKIDGLLIVRRDNPVQSEVCLQQPVLIFSIQGEKRYAAGSEIIDYKQGQIVFQGAPIPCSSYVLKASRETPYVAMVLAVNIQLMTEIIHLLDNMDVSSVTHSYSRLGRVEAGSELIESFIR
ncbi:MAG: AraC family transcriptional regulator, partial [Mucispirillum sp.]|nr:AraC family transcriptional regulator [Mucispirillum sp.]